MTCKNAIKFNHHGSRNRHTAVTGLHSRQQIIQQSSNMLCHRSTLFKLDKNIFMSSNIVESCCASGDANQCPGRYMQGKIKGKRVPEKGGAPNRYLLLKSLILGRGTRGTRMCCIFPSNFVSKKIPGTSLFRHKASANQPISSKKYHGRHELEQRNFGPNVGGGGFGERGEEFRDGWR